MNAQNKNSKNVKKTEILEKLKNIPLFKNIKENEANLHTFIGICDTRTYSIGDTIITEGEMGSEMFIVYKGSVEIQKKTRAGDTYNVATLSDKQNVFFGELALIDDDKRSATVIACSNSEFLVISKEKFIELGNNHPEIALPITREIAKILAGRLRKTTQDMLTIFDALVNELSE